MRGLTFRVRLNQFGIYAVRVRFGIFILRVCNESTFKYIVVIAIYVTIETNKNNANQQNTLQYQFNAVRDGDHANPFANRYLLILRHGWVITPKYNCVM